MDFYERALKHLIGNENVLNLQTFVEIMTNVDKDVILISIVKADTYKLTIERF